MNKKIFIVILVIVLLLALCIGIVLIFKTDKTEQVSDANIVDDNVTNTITNEQENVIVEVASSKVENVTDNENTTLENNVGNSMSNNSTNSNNVSINTTEASSNTVSSNITNTTSSKTTSNSSKSTTSGNSSNSSTLSSNKSSTTSTTTKNNTTSTISSATIQDNISDQTKVEEKEPEVIETYTINNDIINKMKSVIENNPSTYMQEYGFNIVVDSSIVNETNQFTYTESRVKNYIANRFGTIKIYARDYYCNGEYVWTESFIL